MRSPYDNKYYPNEEDGTIFPLQELRELEIYLNKVFQLYSKNYYGDEALCSVYIVALGKEVKDGFIVVILIKNSTYIII
ncbi:hypothetical protein GW796_11020 [archaeon]|nr:hypothetical protein [archaeon]NCQ52390.1 hypothetical protein [archaeon]